MRNLSNWRSVRVWEGLVERELRQRHSLRLHGACIGALTLGVTWAASHVLMRLGHDSLAARYGAGSLLMLFAGWEVLLAVAIELAFSYAATRTTIRVMREGWVGAAVRLTWKPLLGAIVCAVALGWSIDHFIPAANSLPQAIKMMGSRPAR